MRRRRALMHLVEKGHRLGPSSGACCRALLLPSLLHLLLPRLARALQLEPCTLGCESLLTQLLSPALRLPDALAVGLVLLHPCLPVASERIRIGHGPGTISIALHLLDAAGGTARLATLSQQQLHVVLRLQRGI